MNDPKNSSGAKTLLFTMHVYLDDERNMSTRTQLLHEVKGRDLCYILAQMQQCMGGAVEQAITARLFTLDQFKEALQYCKDHSDSVGHIETP